MSLQLDRRSEELRLRVVRRALRHDSSPKHVAGTATFVDDMREPEGLLHVAVGGAPIAAGQLLVFRPTDRITIKAVLKDAVPEFGQNPA